MALDAPDKFVLKPQREGGGNNLYGEDIRCVILMRMTYHFCEYLFDFIVIIETYELHE